MLKTKTALQPGLLNNLRYDIPAGVVVSLVGLPLCLGIALASDAPLFSGVITGVIAGIIVGMLSGSELSVSGPAAGLAVIVASAIKHLGSYEAFLCAVVLSGIFQIALGALRAGNLTSLFPVSVIKGLMVSIGITIILKQIPHAVGGIADFHDDMGVWDITGHDNIVGEIARSLLTFNSGAVLICLLSLVLLRLWETDAIRRTRWLGNIPGPLVAVVSACLLNQFFHLGFPGLGVTAEDGHLVNLPNITSLAGFFNELSFPDFRGLETKAVWVAALAITAVGSIESLLCMESTERMDPFQRTSNNSRELIAQGTGNILAGLAGGIPMTSVIVRSSANIYAGARTRMATITHGVILLLCALLIPHILSLIPLASLAAVLIAVGYRLAHPHRFVKMYEQGLDQFLPFMVTVVAVLLTNLLTGVLIGLAVGLIVVVKASYYSAITFVRDGDHALIRFTKDVTFVHKLKLKQLLHSVPAGSKLFIDGSRAMFVDADIYEMLEEYGITAKQRDIELEMVHLSNKKFHFLVKGTR